MPKSKKSSRYYTEYMRERRNLQRRIRTAQKRGFVFDETPLPSKPKNITKSSVEKLRNIRGESLYKKASYYVGYEGEVLQKPTIKELRKEAARKGQRTRELNKQIKQYKYDVRDEIEYGETPPSYSDEIITEIERLIDSVSPDDFSGNRWLYQQAQEHANILKELLQNAIMDAEYEDENMTGREYLAMQLNQSGNASKITEIVEYIIYESHSQDTKQAAITEFAELLNGGALSLSEKMNLSDIYYDNFFSPK